MIEIKRIILSPNCKNVCMYIETHDSSGYLLLNKNTGIQKVDKSIVDQMMHNGWISMIRLSTGQVEACYNSAVLTLTTDEVQTYIDSMMQVLDEIGYNLVPC